uniref:Uncharacterized protein n=1 Tax=Solanum lycopersicum TaxID=4081 RepID=A0A3Q7IEF3_SOLLC
MGQREKRREVPLSAQHGQNKKEESRKTRVSELENKMRQQQQFESESLNNKVEKLEENLKPEECILGRDTVQQVRRSLPALVHDRPEGDCLRGQKEAVV